MGDATKSLGGGSVGNRRNPFRAQRSFASDIVLIRSTAYRSVSKETDKPMK